MDQRLSKYSMKTSRWVGLEGQVTYFSHNHWSPNWVLSTGVVFTQMLISTSPACNISIIHNGFKIIQGFVIICFQTLVDMQKCSPAFCFLQGRLLIYQNFQHLWTFEMDKKHKVDTVDRIAGRPNPPSNVTPSQTKGLIVDGRVEKMGSASEDHPRTCR